jgi:hypothetical protein
VTRTKCAREVDEKDDSLIIPTFRDEGALATSGFIIALDRQPLDG